MARRGRYRARAARTMIDAGGDMAHSPADVCVVGGGPAGLLVGLLLAKRGARVIVLEGHETFDREFRGEVLQPSTARLVDEIGLLEYIRAQPHLTLTSGRLLVHGRPAGGFDFRRIAPKTLERVVPEGLDVLAPVRAPGPGQFSWGPPYNWTAPRGPRAVDLAEVTR